MIRYLAYLLLAASGLAGCGSPDPFAGHDWPAARPAIWEATSPGGQKGWLFGTIHALPDGLEWRTGPVDAAFEQADLLVVEIAELGDSEQAAMAFEEVSHTAGLPPLAHRVDPRGRPALAALMERAGAQEGEFADTETWAAALKLAGMVRAGNPANGVDRVLLASGKPAVGLESHHVQYALFDALPEQDQLDMLLSVAHESAASDPAEAIESWLAGDMARLERIGSAGLLADRGLRDALLDSRNRAWATRVATLIEEGHAPFVAVGAAHMMGEAGLPTLLAARGFAVRRLQ